MVQSDQQSVRLNCGLLVLLAATFFLFSTASFAHEFGAGKSQYEDFLSGNQAVLEDLPVLLGLIAAGLFSSIWKPDGLPTLWPFYIAGLIAGAALGFSGFLPPVLPTYIAVVIIGLLGAAAPALSTPIMRGIYVLIGMVLTNAILSGHTIAEIPTFSYLGIAFALNVGLAMCAGLVTISLEKLPYGWVIIAWRAGMSWLVAITVMALALMLNG